VTIRAVTVDLWGTLLFDPPTADDRHMPRRVADFATILGAAGRPIARSVLEQAYRDSGAFLNQLWLQHRDVPVQEHVRAILVNADAKLDAELSPETVERLVQAYARPALDSPPAAAEGARAALDTLTRRGYALALVSNTMRTPGVTLREILRRYELLGFFAHLFFSDECGVRKPEPVIFRRALDALAVEPGEAVHVGDDPVLDVEGARAAGMRVIQLTARRAPWFGRQKPHATIATLSELPDAVAKLDR
jgi:HAD superfamily hydrolase (TIGR01549 family)